MVVTVELPFLLETIFWGVSGYLGNLLYGKAVICSLMLILYHLQVQVTACAVLVFGVCLHLRSSQVLYRQM